METNGFYKKRSILYPSQCENLNFKRGRPYFETEQGFVERFEHELVPCLGQVVHQRGGAREHADYLRPVLGNVVQRPGHDVGKYHCYQHPLTGLVAERGH